MSRIPVNLATEDELSEITLIKILAALDRFAVGTAYRRGGSGYLRRTIHGWNNAARGQPFIVLTDLDTMTCPSELINQWLSSPRHPNLLFRVAVREVESWLLADRKHIAEFLGIPASRVPLVPDGLGDPKGTIVVLAQKSRKDIRSRLVPRRDSTAKQGPDYNACLGQFVTSAWDVKSASENSPSLARTLDRLDNFRPSW